MTLEQEIFLSALELISDPARWTQDTSARNSEDDSVCAHDKTAVRWCSSGALLAVTCSDSRSPIRVFGVEETLLKARNNVDNALNDAAYRVFFHLQDSLDAAQDAGEEDLEPYVFTNDHSDYIDVMQMWELAGKNKGWL